MTFSPELEARIAEHKKRSDEIIRNALKTESEVRAEYSLCAGPMNVVQKPISNSVLVKHGHWTSIFYPLIKNPILTGLIGGILVYIALSVIAVALGWV